jgi:hypothetical protein
MALKQPRGETMRDGRETMRDGRETMCDGRRSTGRRMRASHGSCFMTGS